MLVASLFGSWNTVQYAFLHQLIAKCCGLDVGSFSHFVMNSHIYNKHWEDNKLFNYVEQSLDNELVKFEINVENDINDNIRRIIVASIYIISFFIRKMLKLWQIFRII